MKTIKYILSVVALISLIWSCSEELDNFDFVSTAKAPEKISALYSITQDNTGLVTITPNGEGASSFQIYFGDNTVNPVSVKQGESVKHIYKEGTYKVKIIGTGVTGLKMEVIQDLVVSFIPPKNLVVVITNDLAVSKKVNVTANADYATFFEVYFGEAGTTTPVTANIGGTASYIYKAVGTYKIRVVAKGGAIKTTEETKDFVVTAILQPIASAPTPPTRGATDVISIYSDKYTNVAGTNYNPDWGQSGQGSSFAEFNLAGDKMLQYIKLSYQGIQFGSTVNAAAMQFLHIDVWTADATSIEIFPISLATGEKKVVRNLVKDQWNSFDIPLSEFTSQGLSMADLHQFKFVGVPWAGGTVFIDNIYFHKPPAPASGLAGTWKIAPEAGAIGVGPTAGDTSWWANSAADVTTRACFFDDTYVFNANGTFNNVLGSSTWLEPWQGVNPEACGTPIAPHNGSANATYIYDSVGKTITINGKGAYLGLSKAFNGGELSNPANAPASITYNAVLSSNNNVMNLQISIGGGFWHFKLVRVGAVIPPPTSGTAPYNPINFETGGFGANWTWTVFENGSNPPVEIVANPFKTGINTSATVAKITALKAGQPWVGCESKHGADIGSFKFDATNKIVRIWVYKTVISDVGLKFAEANGDAQPEVKVANTKINEWEELRFDMSGSIGKGATGIVDQIIIFPDFNLLGRTSDNVVYFDNITFSSN